MCQSPKRHPMRSLRWNKNPSWRKRRVGSGGVAVEMKCGVILQSLFIHFSTKMILKYTLVLHNYYQKRKYIKEQMKRKKIGCAYLYPSLIIDSYLGDWSGRPPRPKQRVGSERPWHKESHDMRDSVWDGLWRPGGAFFQIGLGCVMSHHHIEGLCIFLFKFWRENSKWSSCQQLVLQKHTTKMHLLLGSRSERGGARRAPTKRVILNWNKVKKVC